MGPRRNLYFLIVGCGLLMASLMMSGCDSANSEVEGGNVGRTPDSFRISPSAAAIYDDTAVVVFSVVGGEAPFAWSVSDTSLGTVTPTTSLTREVNYRPTGTTGREGVNTVRVTDHKGNAASASLVHETATP